MAKKDVETDEDAPEDEPLEEENAGEQPIDEDQPVETGEDPPKPEPEIFDNSKLKVEECMNIDYVSDDQVKKDLTEIVDALKDKEKANVKIASNHDMTVAVDRVQKLKITPLKTSFSASFCGGKVERPTKDAVIDFINNDFVLDE